MRPFVRRAAREAARRRRRRLSTVALCVAAGLVVMGGLGCALTRSPAAAAAPIPITTQAAPTTSRAIPTTTAVRRTTEAPAPTTMRAVQATTPRTAAPAPAPVKKATVIYTCDVSGPPEFGDPAHPNDITNKACGYVDGQGRQRSHDPWIDGQLLHP
ncbi:hypothetical protein [Pseudonocardia sp.]|jgi:hypothetical protein|uniref:hypothetical protein n=1 Tax=Pseudonocardia sp. TaxID=60912 RepID=UPI002629E5DB|nr:hypothetical protein [Pseudonocardia sp.]MCW2717599.1 hypothetical protein [Pseudonocardia sp.]MDT7617550.1 hypothetical protein [Pseudonocardiales bacterium]